MMKWKTRYPTEWFAKTGIVAVIPTVLSLTPQPVLLYARVSHRSQMKHLQHQIADLKAKLEAAGFTAVRVFWEVANGWEEDRPGFKRAIRKARKTELLLVAASVDRFWRSEKGDKIKPLSKAGLGKLLSKVEGVRLATWHPADKPPEEVHGEHTKRGQRGKRRFGGRPKESKKAIKERLWPVARKLRLEGVSLDKIVEKLGRPRGTIRDWICGVKPNPSPSVTGQRGNP
jgi:DNA invertase Pin-like site-specific DNA recombinase